MRKYYIKHTDEYGNIIFNHSSDNATRLIKMLYKSAYSEDGNMYANFYFGKMNTNIPKIYWELA